MKEIDGERTDMEDLFFAMQSAKEAFDKYFEDRGLDGAYWHLELTGYVLTSEFEKWKKLHMDFLDYKKGE